MSVTDLTQAWDDAVPALESDPMRPLRYRKCLRYVQTLDRGTAIADIGCGEGSGLLLLRTIGFRRLIGVEVSVERLHRARTKLGDAVPLILAPATGALPFLDASVDVVVSAGVIEHTVDPRSFLSEISRVVRPGGCVVISSDCYSWRILQLVGLYRSVQPIDRALFPTTLFRHFHESGLQVIDYEGFRSPSGERSLPRMAAAILVALIAQATLKMTRGAIGRRMKRSARHILSQPSPDHLSPEGGRQGLEQWPRKSGIASFLNLIFSDENVFFLVKK